VHDDVTSSWLRTLAKLKGVRLMWLMWLVWRQMAARIVARSVAADRLVYLDV